MKTCGYCGDLLGKAFRGDYCCPLHEACAEARDVSEDNVRRREEERRRAYDKVRNTEIIRVTLQTMEAETQFTALARLALEALNNLNGDA